MNTLVTSLLLALSLGLTSPSATYASNRAAEGNHPADAVTFQTSVLAEPTGKLNVSLNKQTGGRAWMQLKDKHGAVLFTHIARKKDPGFRARLDLSELPDGTYTVEFSNGVETTQQKIVLHTPLQATSQRSITTLAMKYVG